jgi:hypothetical protein
LDVSQLSAPHRTDHRWVDVLQLFARDAISRRLLKGRSAAVLGA